MRRQVQPEILDSLPPNHPDALRNRRDLRLTNLLMGNFAWWRRRIRPLVRKGERVLEIGAGTGELAERLAARGVAVDGLDLWPRPAKWPADRAWHQVDLLGFDGYGDYDAVFANLILHQFTAEELAGLGERLQRNARLIVACEPTRRQLSQVFFARVAPLLGASRVSLHDAHVSISAGFVDHELPEMLGLDPDLWLIQCDAAPMGAYRMIARRR